MSKWIEVALEEDCEQGAKICKSAGTKQLVICNVQGEFHAFADMCPHAGLPLSQGPLNGNSITCQFPSSFRLFDLSGSEEDKAIRNVLSPISATAPTSCCCPGRYSDGLIKSPARAAPPRPAKIGILTVGCFQEQGDRITNAQNTGNRRGNSPYAQVTIV